MTTDEMPDLHSRHAMAPRLSLGLLLTILLVANFALLPSTAMAAEEQKVAEIGWRDFTAKMFSNLAWPLLVAVVIWYFRAEIRDRINKLQKVEAPGGFKGEFAEGLRYLQEEARAEGLPTVPILDTEREGVSVPQEEAVLEDLIRTAPTAAVARAFNDVQETIMRQYGDDYPGSGTAWRWTRARLTPSLQRWFDHLYALRNEAVHSRDKSITPAQAAEYVQIARRVIAEIEEGDWGSSSSSLSSE